MKCNYEDSMQDYRAKGLTNIPDGGGMWEIPSLVSMEANDSDRDDWEGEEESSAQEAAERHCCWLWSSREEEMDRDRKMLRLGVGCI